MGNKKMYLTKKRIREIIKEELLKENSQYEPYGVSFKGLLTALRDYFQEENIEALSERQAELTVKMFMEMIESTLKIVKNAAD